MSIESRRNYWNEQMTEDHESWWHNVIEWLAVAIAITLVAACFYTWGKKDGYRQATKEACSTEAGAYYLRGFCP